MKYFFILFCFYTGNVFSQGKNIAPYSDVDFVTQWYRTIFPLTEAEAATVSARGLAYIDIAFYECAAIASPYHVSMSAQLNNFKLSEELIKKRSGGEYYAPLAVNKAMMKITLEMFRNVQSRPLRNVIIHADSMDLLFKSYLDKQAYEASNSIGSQIADKIILWAKEDKGFEKSLQPYDIYYKNKKNCDSCWVFNERSLKSGGPMTPTWGDNRLFVKENENINIVPKLTFSTEKKSLFYQQALEVYQKNKISSHSANAYTEKEKLADFWNDASNLDDAYTPATHSHSILIQCFEKDLKLQLPDIAEIFCKLGVGLSDAFVVAWKEKQEHFLIRPDTYIQRYIDKNWHPFINTPPFPEFPSGHTTQIGAFEGILASFFGEKFTFSDNRQYRGRKTFVSFSQVAEEVVEARILGGMHYRFSCEQGRNLGNQVAQNIVKLNFKNNKNN